MPCHCGSDGATRRAALADYIRFWTALIVEAVAAGRSSPYRRAMTALHPSARLTINLAALARNYRQLAGASGAAACGAAVKANAYGLGTDAVVPVLLAAGCRSFFVASLDEALVVRALAAEAEVILLHGLGAADIAAARAANILPTINTPQQARDWQVTGASCAAMIDTGINRLGLGPDQLTALDGLNLTLVMSHLACADDPTHPANAAQLALFNSLALPGVRRSLANSCGIGLGPGYHFDLTRPGIGLYGGLATSETVITAEAQLLQKRLIPAGQSVGYGATWTAPRDTQVATIGLGYADGYLRSFSNQGVAHWQGIALPVIGRVSMDMVTLDISAAPALNPGDWVQLIGPQMSLTQASAKSHLSEYELLTSLGPRYQRVYQE
jgi:alanine racemase